MTRPLSPRWIGALFSVGLLAVATVPALAAWLLPPSGIRPKDFTVVKRNGLYHVFYIRNNPFAPPESTQVEFGHSTSKDLYFWQHQPSVMPVRPGRFDRSHVWAPSVVERDGVYYMFYTGVSDSVATGDSLRQQIGLATSTDLVNWNAYEEPVLSAAAMPWAWNDPTAGTPFRDPFVMPDPGQPGRWLMYLCTAPASDPLGQVAGVAASDGDFTQWVDVGPLWTTHRSWTYNDQVESPHLFEHGGLWYLFYTTRSGQPITLETSPDPLAPPTQWFYRGRLGTMLGVNTAGWFASEHFRDGLVDYFAFVNGDRIDIRRIQWSAGWEFQLVQPDLFHVQQILWSADSVRAGGFADLSIQSSWWAGRSLTLDAFWRDSTGTLHPVPRAAIGFPDEIPLTADLTQYRWSAQPLPDSLGAPPQPELVLRMPDQTATSNGIQLLPALPSDDPPGPSPGPWQDPGESGSGGGGGGNDDWLRFDEHPRLRTLKQGALGSRPEVLVDLPAGAHGKLEVFDLQGRRVAVLADRMLPVGATVLGWDGHDAAGRAAPRGIYFARLRLPDRVLTARVLLR